jgi:hypothetical protein
MGQIEPADRRAMQKKRPQRGNSFFGLVEPFR